MLQSQDVESILKYSKVSFRITFRVSRPRSGGCSSTGQHQQLHPGHSHSLRHPAPTQFEHDELLYSHEMLRTTSMQSAGSEQQPNKAFPKEITSTWQQSDKRMTVLTWASSCTLSTRGYCDMPHKMEHSLQVCPQEVNFLSAREKGEKEKKGSNANKHE